MDFSGEIELQAYIDDVRMGVADPGLKVSEEVTSRFPKWLAIRKGIAIPADNKAALCSVLDAFWPEFQAEVQAGMDLMESA